MKNVLFKKQFEKYTSYQHSDKTPISIDYKAFNSRPQFCVIKQLEGEETFLKEINNPLFRVVKVYSMVVVEESGDKVSFKFFHGSKVRQEGKPYFTTSKNVQFLTVNKKTGDVYSGGLSDYQKKRKFIKTIKKNYFAHNPFDILISTVKNNITSIAPNENAALIVNDAAHIFISKVCGINLIHNRSAELFKFYLDKKNIKYPNNFYLYTPHLVGSVFRKILKKNNYRLVDAFIQYNNLHGKKIKKYLHVSNNLNIGLYQIAQKMFGEQTLTQDGDSILKILNFSGEVWYFHNSNIYLNNSSISKKELKNIYACFKKTFFDAEIDSNTFFDHVRLYKRLKDFGETNLKWLSDGSDYDYFRKEHLDWSDKVSFYVNGNYYRKYPTFFYSKIEEEINGYFPVILKDSKNYIQESLVQSNCVKTYIGKASSLIISIRKGDVDSDVRATVEYIIQKKHNVIEATRIQTLGRFNMPLDMEWDEILLKLDKIVLSCCNDGMFDTVKIKKVCANGVEYFSDSEFNEYGNLIWTHKQINAVENTHDFIFDF